MDRYAARRDKLRKALRKTGVSNLLVTSFVNVTYLTGFTGDDSYLLVRDKGETLLSDPRYTTQLEEECPGLELAIRKSSVSMLDWTTEHVKSAKASRLGIEGASMTVSLRESLSEKLPAVELVTTAGLVQVLRIIKDKEEVIEIRRAIDQAQRAFGVLRASLRPDQTEKQIAAELESQIRLFGGKGCAFEPIIAAGPRAALRSPRRRCRSVPRPLRRPSPRAPPGAAPGSRSPPGSPGRRCDRRSRRSRRPAGAPRRRRGGW